MEFWVPTVVAAITSLLFGWLTLVSAKRWGWAIDRNEAAYKCHHHRVPRLGGIAVAVGLICGLLLAGWQAGEYRSGFLLLGIVLTPAFLVGLLEDFLQTMGTMVRLLATMFAASLGWWLLDARLLSLDVYLLDTVLASHWLIAFGFTLFAAAGVSHAINIIDGCNGLSSFVAMVILISIAAVANQVDDRFVFLVAVVCAASILGFFFWNFPFGRVFLGDGGAYLVGMTIAVLSIMLVKRNPSVSPWFPLLLCMYPVWETLYSAYRRMVIQGLSPGSADRLHLHNLIYYRLVKRSPRSVDSHRQQTLQSSVAAIHAWTLVIACALPALLFWDQTVQLKLCCALFALSYVGLYRAFVQFRAPRSPIGRSRRLPGVPEAESGRVY